MDTRFEWDEDKAAGNLDKHGVSFEDAIAVFEDFRSITIFDQSHSDDEDRYIDIGMSNQGQILTVVYTERGTRIRIISARNATPREQKYYEDQEG